MPRTVSPLCGCFFLLAVLPATTGGDRGDDQHDRRLLIKLRPAAVGAVEPNKIVQCDTTAGVFELEMKSEWSPLGGEHLESPPSPFLHPSSQQSASLSS
jgi:hypothetical protein